MSIATLIQAAEFLERRDRESEHGYAASLPVSEDYSRKRTKNRKAQGNRSSHNQLEKNRRAHLRHCLERLKCVVPLQTDSTRHTTLGLLTKAKYFIKTLEEKDRRQKAVFEQLAREQRYLHRRLEVMSRGQYRVPTERSISECSTRSSASSSLSNASVSSESDEVDILGYGSSDTDDQSSIQSNGSDGGLAVTTSRSSLADNVL